MLDIHVDGFEMKKAVEFLRLEDNERYLHRIVEPSVERFIEQMEKTSKEMDCEYETVRQTVSSVLSDILYRILTNSERLMLVHNVQKAVIEENIPTPGESIPSGLEGLEMEIISIDEDSKNTEGV